MKPDASARGKCRHPERDLYFATDEETPYGLHLWCSLCGAFKRADWKRWKRPRVGGKA